MNTQADISDRINSAESLISRGELSAAIDMLSEALEIPDAWVLMAVCSDRMGKVDARRKFLDRAIAGGRGLVKRSRLLAAIEALDSLEPVIAALGLSRGVAQVPTETIRMGEDSYALGDNHAALEYFLEACRAVPDNPAAWNNVGVALFALERLEAAEIALKAALSADSAHQEARMNLARVYSDLGRSAEAATQARHILRLNPNDASARTLLVELGVTCVGKPRATIISGKVDTSILWDVLRAAGYRPAELPIELVKSGLDLESYIDGALLLVAGDVDAAAAFDIAARKGIPAWKINALGCAPELPNNPAEAIAVLAGARSVTTTDGEQNPWLSIVVPTFDRHICLINLLDRIALQRIEPRLFEVIIVDDGSPVPAEIATKGEAWPFRLKVIRQSNAGPARARNTGNAQARGRFILWFNDDALPANNVVGGHLLAQLAEDQPTAVLGKFDFTPEAQEHAFVTMLQQSSLLFQYVDMKPGEKNDWRYFYTCNLSMPRAALEAVGGFDEAFPHAICEDTELGFRAEKQLNVKVRYLPELEAWHDHGLDVERYVKRQQLLGVNTYRMWRKHGSYVAPWLSTAEKVGDAFFLGIRSQVEKDEASITKLVSKISELERSGLPNGQIRVRELKALTEATARVSAHEYRRGLACAANGLALEVLRAPKPNLVSQKISVIVPNLNGFPHLIEMLETLRTTDTGPHEIIIVDNGSNDGSLEYLKLQSDVTLIALGKNLGAPTARNRGLAIASGEMILFCDNDVVFTPGWRELLCYHLAAWPDIGLVGPSSNYVVPIQRATLKPEPAESLNDYSARLTASIGRGAHRWSNHLILFFLLVHRDVIDAIGGIDEDFNPWGFEDNDFTLRARVAGFRPRIALDCFIRHLGSRSQQSAKLDYNSLLFRNWQIFKEKWNLPSDLAYGDLSRCDTLPSYSRDQHYKDFHTSRS